MGNEDSESLDIEKMLRGWYKSIYNDYGQGVEEELILRLEKHPEMLTVEKQPIGITLIHAAADNGKLQLMKYLTTIGFSVDGKLLSGVNLPPLFFAISGFYRLNMDNPNEIQIEMMRWLLEQGASVEFGDKYRASSVAAAVVSGNIEAVEFLLAQGADINVRFYNDDQMSIFNALSLAKDDEMRDYLLAHGAQELLEFSAEDYEDYEDFEDEDDEEKARIWEINRKEEIKDHIEKTCGHISKDLFYSGWNIIYPDKDKHYITLITNSLSQNPMMYDMKKTCPEKAYAELIIKLPPVDIRYFTQDWPMIMRIIAQAYESEQYFVEGSIFPFGEDSGFDNYPMNSDFFGVLVSKPEDETVAVCHTANGDSINFYVLKFIYPEEAELAAKYGADYLQALFRKSGIGEVMDKCRVNVAMLDNQSRGVFR